MIVAFEHHEIASLPRNDGSPGFVEHLHSRLVQQSFSVGRATEKAYPFYAAIVLTQRRKETKTQRHGEGKTVVAGVLFFCNTIVGLNGFAVGFKAIN